MTPLLIDFESFFDSDYSVKKISTSEYVRDPRFKIHGVAVRGPFNEQAVWLTERDLSRLLISLPPEQTIIVAHHAQFDAFILREKFGYVPAQTFCTRDAARFVLQGLVDGYDLDTICSALGVPNKLKTLNEFKGKRDLTPDEFKALGEYACRDADSGWDVFQKLWPAVPEFERQAMSLHHRMFIDPVLELDVDRAIKARDMEFAENAATIAASGATIKQLRGDAFVRMLEAKGVEIKTKVTPKGHTKPALAKSDEFMKELLFHEDESIRRLAAGRIVAKGQSQGLRAQRFINAATTGDGRIPMYYNYFGAHTGRASGGNQMNVQNLKSGGELRRSIRAALGQVLGVSDSGQIECRMNGWLWGQDDLLDAFRTGRDIYCELATDIYGRPITKNDPTERFVGKTAELGLGFRMGWKKFQVTLLRGDRGAPVVRLDDSECLRTVNVYRGKRSRIANGWEVLDDAIKFLAHGSGKREFGKLVFDADQGSVLIPSGRELLYPHMQRDDNGNYFYMQGNRPVWTHGGAMDENIVQALARDVVFWQMLNISKELRVVMMTHDEVVALLEEARAQEQWTWMRDQMLVAPPWCSDLPLKAEGGFAREYSK